MITLSKENVVDYVKSRLDFFNPDGDIKVSAIGEGSVEEDGDGFINFVYRVSDGEHHLIVKQSTLEARSKGSFTVMRRIVYLLQKMFPIFESPASSF